MKLVLSPTYHSMDNITNCNVRHTSDNLLIYNFTKYSFTVLTNSYII